MTRAFAAVLIAMLLVFNAAAAEYPSRPIRIIVPFTAGSASDILARMIGPKLAETWGHSVVVDNRPSAGGTVAGGIVASATPDAHTLLLTSSAFAGSAALYEKLPYDAIKDFAGVTMVAVNPLVLVVAPALGPKTVKDLIALAKQKSGQLNYASSGIGSGTHYGGELFKLAAGINAVHVPYRGTPEALTDTMSGRVHYYLPAVLSATPLIKSGRLLGLGVTSLQRAPMLPDVPTIAEAGLPGFEYEGWFGVLTPARTPRPVIDKLAQEIARILRLPEITEKIASTGGIAKSSSPAVLDKLVRDEIATRGKVFKAAGAKAE